MPGGAHGLKLRATAAKATCVAWGAMRCHFQPTEVGLARRPRAEAACNGCKGDLRCLGNSEVLFLAHGGGLGKTPTG